MNAADAPRPVRGSLAIALAARAASALAQGPPQGPPNALGPRTDPRTDADGPGEENKWEPGEEGEWAPGEEDGSEPGGGANGAERTSEPRTFSPRTPRPTSGSDVPASMTQGPPNAPVRGGDDGEGAGAPERPRPADGPA